MKNWSDKFHVLQPMYSLNKFYFSYRNVSSDMGFVFGFLQKGYSRVKYVSHAAKDRDGNKSLTCGYPVQPNPNGLDFTRPDK